MNALNTWSTPHFLKSAAHFSQISAYKLRRISLISYHSYTPKTHTISNPSGRGGRIGEDLRIRWSKHPFISPCIRHLPPCHHHDTTMLSPQTTTTSPPFLEVMMYFSSFVLLLWSYMWNMIWCLDDFAMIYEYTCLWVRCYLCLDHCLSFDLSLQ